MRKFAAILLLAILVFNWVGYRVVSGYLEHRSAISLEAKLDVNDYADSDLIELTIPLNLPYVPESQSFERYDGEISLNGIHYKYVKRKVAAGNLVLLCLPDINKTRIEKVKGDYFQAINSLPSSKADGSSKGKPVLQKSVFSDYWLQQNIITISPSLYSRTNHYTQNIDLISLLYTKACDHPPDC